VAQSREIVGKVVLETLVMVAEAEPIILEAMLVVLEIPTTFGQWSYQHHLCPRCLIAAIRKME
jgi:hypothetical protein